MNNPPMTAETNFIFENRPDDIPPTELEVEGTVPGTLRGRFLANGPGRTQINGQKLVWQSAGSL